MNFIATGIGAGLVSALLTAVLIKGTALAFMLYLLAPLPILIVSLGWNHRSGLIAAFVGGGVIAVLLSPLQGLLFTIVTALPAWWLAYLTLLGRPNSDGTTEWYPIGRLLAWIAGTSALTIVATAFLSAGNYETFHNNARRIAETFINAQFPASDAEGLDAETRNELTDWFARATPMLSAQGFTVILSLYLWTAAKIVNVSGRLPRPWVPVPSLMMPRRIGLLLVLGFALTLVSGFIGVFGLALTGALFMAFALQGLAAIHERTQGKTGRGILLTGLYILMLLTQGILIIALFLFGLADTVFGLRQRFQRGSGPKPPPNPLT